MGKPNKKHIMWDNVAPNSRNGCREDTDNGKMLVVDSCNCVSIRQVLEFHDIENGLSMHGTLSTDEAVAGGRVAP